MIERYNWLTGTGQFFSRDELNRVKERRINTGYKVAGTRYFSDYSKEVYGYDEMSRLLTTDRTLRFAGTGLEVRRDDFDYNDAGELILAEYDQTPSGQSFTAPARTGKAEGVRAYYLHSQ